MVVKRRNRGQSIVEMALLLPFLLFLTVGTMELGYYVYMYSELENVARRAAEWAADSPPLTATPSDDVPGRDRCAVLIKQHGMDNAFLSRLNYSNFVISYVGASERQIGNQIQVTLTYQGRWLTPLGDAFLGDRLRFQFTARRTIRDLGPPALYNPDCTPRSP